MLSIVMPVRVAAFSAGALLPRAPPRQARPALCASAPTPPTDVDATVQLATSSLSAALSAGHRRVRVVALIPGLNPLVEDTFAFSSATLNSLAVQSALNTPQLRDAPQCALLFASAGAAAAAATQYRRAGVELPDSVYTATFNEPNEYANVLVSPQAMRGDPLLPQLQRSTALAPHALWVMLNGDLSGERAAVGMRESAARAAFEESFELAFYFRNLFVVRRPSLRAEEKGALLFCRSHPWRVFALRATGEYQLVGEWEQRPDGAQVARLLEQSADVPRVVDDGDAAVDARFVRVVLLGSVLAGALVAALLLRQPL